MIEPAPKPELQRDIYQRLPERPPDVKILDKEARWFEQGVKETIWERVEAPSLNRRGGLRFRLSHSWDTVLRAVPSSISAYTNNHA